MDSEGLRSFVGRLKSASCGVVAGGSRLARREGFDGEGLWGGVSGSELIWSRLSSFFLDVRFLNILGFGFKDFLGVVGFKKN